jgi:hypothetical protein
MLPEVPVLIKDSGPRDDERFEAFLLAETTTVGIYVYGDACEWSTTTPPTPATTVDEVIAALADQPSRDASEPVDITVDGYSGRAITLHVPDDMRSDGYESFPDCDDDTFTSFGVGTEAPGRFHQGPGQIDELWFVDVDGAIAVIDLTYWPDTSAADIEELRALAETATFELQ